MIAAGDPPGDEIPALSTQLLQETCVALTRKLGMDESEALSALLRLLDNGTFAIQAISTAFIWRAAMRVI